jgi:predicted enzyme related to lactoylglutathione lyase
MDVEKAKAFYAETLGWTFEEFALPDGAYWVAKSGDKMVFHP